MRILGKGGFGRAAKGIVPTALLAFGIAGGVAPQSAQAQFFNWGNGWGNGAGWNDGRDWGGAGPGQIYRTLSERGFRVIAPLRRNGAVYVTDVLDRRGRRERLIVASADGQILQRFMLDAQPAGRRAEPQPYDDLEQQMERADRGDTIPPVPPAVIPNVEGYNRDDGSVDGNAVIEPVRPRQSLRVLRPVKPRLVERTPDAMLPDAYPMEPDGTASQPTRLKARPSQPLRLPGAPATASDRPNAPPTVTASRPIEAAPVPSAQAPGPAVSPEPSGSASGTPIPSTRMRDPLAIPRGDDKATDAPKPSAAAGVEQPRKVAPVKGTAAVPQAQAQKPAKTGDVPVAPLD